ncbi:MAG: MGH1-like glycoside hydrolase domain-containing protein [Phycisphaerae bacterium]
MTEEEKRLRQTREEADWKIWGPYLSERTWGTVREDYSADGSAWEYFPHDHARSRAYRWNEDGLLGICDRRQYLCFAMALWNGKDPILKERAFGLTGPQGNHGEDVKEYFYFLDSTPSHSYMKAVYKYPQGEFPYAWLVAENARRGRDDPEFELLDTGVFGENRYFDVQVEYAKQEVEDVFIRFTVFNRGPEEARLTLLPSLWFRNTWSWGNEGEKPRVSMEGSGSAVLAEHGEMGAYVMQFEERAGVKVLFTENETNNARLFQSMNRSPWVKDAFHRYIVNGDLGAVNPEGVGTKCAVVYEMTIPAGGSETVRLRLAKREERAAVGTLAAEEVDALFEKRIKEADAFYEKVATPELPADLAMIQRQAFAGLLWCKQFYHYDVKKWLEGDPACPVAPASRWLGRNHEWLHIANDSVMSMPDCWEYPWYAAWDLAFHTISLALIDPDFAKRQLILLLREWFMHPSGQLPAYEWAFGDVNPPVHAWAALRVYRIERKMKGKGDTLFLERVFQKLLMNFTWWVNRKDADGRNIFQGGFLGLDNIGLFDRSKPLPGGAHLDQSDGTAWMAMYCLNMLAIAVELAQHDDAYEDTATKFLEHFFYIASAMNDRPSIPSHDDESNIDLWDDDDGFYYDVLHKQNGEHQFLKVRSMVGLIPLLAVETIEPKVMELLPDFARRLEWFIANRPELTNAVASVTVPGKGDRRLFSIVNAERLQCILSKMLDENEFLSPHGLRSVSRYHLEHPAVLQMDGHTYSVDYEPAESRTSLFGGNSNWRGPVWFPLNYLIIESLQKFDFYYGDNFMVECPTGSGEKKTLWEVGTDLSKRLISIFARGEDGRRPVFGGCELFQNDPLWRDLMPFHEYFHGDNGAGLGASHQTGWTALVAKLIQQSGSRRPVASASDERKGSRGRKRTGGA